LSSQSFQPMNTFIIGLCLQKFCFLFSDTAESVGLLTQQ
jgi:hypothetical protein